MPKRHMHCRLEFLALYSSHTRTRLRLSSILMRLDYTRHTMKTIRLHTVLTKLPIAARIPIIINEILMLMETSI